MLNVLEHPKTLDQVQHSIQKWFGEPTKNKDIPVSFSRTSKSSNRLCVMSRTWRDLRLETTSNCVHFRQKHRQLTLNLDLFLISTEWEGEKFCLNIETNPEPEHRFLNSALREMADTKYPAFQSRVLRAFINLAEDLPNTTIDEATAAPTDYLVALEALSSAPWASQLIADDPFVAAKLRGLKRKKQMLEASGGALTSEQVAEVLGISRQAVDKRRSSNQLLALTQGRRGYSYPSFQFDDGKTLKGLEEVLAELSALDPWMQMVFFTNTNERLGGKTPIESLQKGLVEEVKNAAKGYGEQGAL